MKGIDSTGAHLVHDPGWMDGWVGGWVDGSKSHFKVHNSNISVKLGLYKQK
jgi:hypothetical protein